MLGGLNQMKKLIGVLVFGLLLTVFTVVPASAQEPTRESVYNTYLENYDKRDIASKKKALDAAKLYISKFNEETDKEQVEYFKSAVPALEKAIQDLELDARKKEEEKAWGALLTRFDSAVRADQWDQVFATGKEVLGKQLQYVDPKIVNTQKFDVGIVLATIGFDLAEAKNNKFNNDAIDYAKRTIQLIEAGQTSDNFGAYGKYQYKTAEYPDGKNNALGWMNYIVGFISHARQDKKKEALPYLYKATQHNSATKNFPQPYELIGAFYYDEVARLEKERQAKVAANEGKDNDETNAIYALQRGYAERGADAYARAFKMETAKKQPVKSYQDFLKSRLEQLYKFRFEDKTDGMDAFVATVNNKPFPNPTTDVQPVKEEIPTTDSTSTDSATTTTPSTKPASSNSTTTKTSATTDANNKTPANNKKPRKR